MNISLRYFSRSGNTKKLADAIGLVLGIPSLEVHEKLSGPVDLLFLGGALYGGTVDGALSKFIDELDPSMVKKVAVFSTSAISKTANTKIKSLVDAKGIEVLEKDYHCPGKFLCLHTKRPNKDDCKDAALFASVAVMNQGE